MLKNFLLIILMTLSVVVFNNTPKVNAVENEIEEQVEYAPQGSISVSTVNDTIFNEKHNNHDELTIELAVVRSDTNIEYILIN